MDEVVIVFVSLVGLLFCALEIAIGVGLQGWYNEAIAAEAAEAAPSIHHQQQVIVVQAPPGQPVDIQDG